MLIGEYSHTIDQKGRLIMPSKLRSEIGDKFVVTKGLEGCLFVYSLAEWQIFEEKLKAFPLTNKNARTLTRFFLAGATECEIDKQGRFLIASNLREYASLEKDVVLIGVLGRIEIWDKQKWDDYNKTENSSVEDIAESLAELGI